MQGSGSVVGSHGLRAGTAWGVALGAWGKSLRSWGLFRGWGYFFALGHLDKDPAYKDAQIAKDRAQAQP